MTPITDPPEGAAAGLGAGALTAGALGAFVVASSVLVAEAGAETLENAFRDRLHAVESVEGFRGLQVWREPRQPGQYLMISWWDSRDAWAGYMRSAEHAASHARIPAEPTPPRPGGLRLFEVVAT